MIISFIQLSIEWMIEISFYHITSSTNKIFLLSFFFFPINYFYKINLFLFFFTKLLNRKFNERKKNYVISHFFSVSWPIKFNYLRAYYMYVYIKWNFKQTLKSKSEFGRRKIEVFFLLSIKVERCLFNWNQP